MEREGVIKSFPSLDYSLPNGEGKGWWENWFIKVSVIPRSQVKDPPKPKIEQVDLLLDYYSMV